MCPEKASSSSEQRTIPLHSVLPPLCVCLPSTPTNPLKLSPQSPLAARFPRFISVLICLDLFVAFDPACHSLKCCCDLPGTSLSSGLWPLCDFSASSWLPSPKGLRAPVPTAPPRHWLPSVRIPQGLVGSQLWGVSPVLTFLLRSWVPNFCLGMLTTPNPGYPQGSIQTAGQVTSVLGIPATFTDFPVSQGSAGESGS